MRISSYSSSHPDVIYRVRVFSQLRRPSRQNVRRVEFGVHGDGLAGVYHEEYLVIPAKEKISSLSCEKTKRGVTSSPATFARKRRQRQMH